MRGLIRTGLEQTGDLWPDVRVAFAWVHRAAQILKNSRGQSEREVRLRLRGLVAAMSRHREKAGTLAPAIGHFLKVTRSYWPGLFACYRIQGLPATNNDLEHLFGAHRYHERRAMGRKVASPALVLRGSVRVLSAMATRLRCPSAAQLQPRDVERWKQQRQQLEQRQQARRCGLRFRRDSNAYLEQLEAQLLQLNLPS